MKKTFAAAAAALMLLALAGCQGKPKTAEELLERVSTALAKTPCTECTGEINMEMSMSMLGQSLGDLEMSREEHMYANTDPAICRSTATSTTVTDGTAETTESDAYILQEEGETVTYTLVDGSWFREVTPNASLGISSDLPTDDLAFDPAATETVNGATVYVLTGTMTGSDIGLDIASLFEGNEDVDLTAMNVDLKLYIDEKTCLPVRTEATLHGLDEMFRQYVESEMAKELEGLDGLDALGDLDMSSLLSIEVSDVVMNFDYLSYKPGEAITLPEEAKAAA